MEYYDQSGKRCQISTKTEDLDEAIQTLNEHLVVVKLIKSGSYKIADSSKKTVNMVADEVIEQISKVQNFKGLDETTRHLKYIKAAIGSFDISKIKKNDLMVIYNQEMSKTKRANFNRAFRLLFNYAIENNYTNRLLEVPEKTAKKSVERKLYTLEQLREIYVFIEDSSRKSKNNKTQVYGALLIAFASFLRRTGLRYGEALNCRYSDVIDKPNTEKEKELIIRQSKTKIRKINLSEISISIINQTLKIKSDFGISTTNSDFIFSAFENKLPDYTGFLKEFKNRYSEDFQKNEWMEFVLYSLRHDFIQRKLTEGFSVFDIARHCGTSVSMIENYYSSTMSLSSPTKIYSKNDYFMLDQN